MPDPLILLGPDDNVLIAIRDLAMGETIHVNGAPVTLTRAIGLGHKIARVVQRAGDTVVKLGAPMGVLTADVAPGDHIHTHNMTSAYLKAKADKAGA